MTAIMAEQNPKPARVWQKGGPSPNPTGRPKGFAAAIRDATGNGETLWRRMIDIWEGREKGFGARERLEAGKWLADRGFGRAPETQLQIQADASEVAGAMEAATETLTELASALEEAHRLEPGSALVDAEVIGGMSGGSDELNPLNYSTNEVTDS